MLEENDRLISVREACHLLGCSRTTLWRMRQVGIGPRWQPIGPNSLRYSLKSVNTFARRKRLPVHMVEAYKARMDDK
ncbi:helix-turn-helix transcriptional regulator [Aquisalimonas asiatica]|uniref:Transcriptional regulator, AlpA family n=1 Tax=Aquisalimonas asiatica TaxID=406100 RepID=A0A1H8UCA6_9GAMM|nr:helix-turn-helix domain-containing protein [Aquisalimonas asiatica]SEP00815.1 transcriptional regulator, AlpA family [Aquisalimonas asiatica]